MKNMFTGIVTAAFLIVNIAPALASSPVAEATGLQGKVLVNHGKGFVSASNSVLLNVGDQIMVGANSSAKINYLNSKCLVSANASSVVTITATVPCKLGTVVGSVDTVFAVPANAPAYVEPPAFPIIPVVLIGGAAVVGGALILLSKKCSGSVSTC